MDNEFKKGFKQLSNEEIDQRIDAVIKLFCCLNGRDMFMTAYTNLLAMRLLNRTSVNNEAEEKMVKQLQIECGHNTVSKIKTMFQDMIKSQQVMNDYKGVQAPSQIEFQVEILTSGHWPYQESLICKIPPQMQRV